MIHIRRVIPVCVEAPYKSTYTYTNLRIHFMPNLYSADCKKPSSLQIYKLTMIDLCLSMTFVSDIFAQVINTMENSECCVGEDVSLTPDATDDSCITQFL